MKNWFDKNRIEMLNNTCTQMLRTEICDGLSSKEIIDVMDTLETFNTGDLVQNGGTTVASHHIDLSSEISQALVAEAVMVEDNNFITQLKEYTAPARTINFDNLAESVPAFVGSRLEMISGEIKKIHEVLDTGKQFIVCGPVELSLLQSARNSLFSVGAKDAFKGPNNTMLVGHLDKIPVYSYIALGDLYTTNSWETCEYIVGVYYEKEDRCITNRLILENVSLV